MFTQYIKNIDALYEEAKKSKHVIYKDFFPIYNIIEKYVKEHKLIVSNKEILIGEKKKGLSRNYPLTCILFLFMAISIEITHKSVGS